MADHPFKFPKKERLCSEIQISDLFQNGESFMSYPVRVVMQVFKPVENPGIQVVISVPKKKLKHAVDRNRVKRLLRETYRLNKQILLEQVIAQEASVRLAFIWVPSEILDYQRVEKKMKEALVKAGKSVLAQTMDEFSTPDTSMSGE